MSDGIIVTINFSFKPGTAQAFAAALPGMFEATRARKGFRSIRAVLGQADPDRMLFVEEWDSAADYQAYLDWRSSRGEDLSSMEAMLTAPPTLEIWDKPVA